MAEPNPTPATAESSATPDPGTRARNRGYLVALFAIAFAPMLIATVMYRTGWVSGAATNHGEMLQPVIGIDAVAVGLEVPSEAWRLLLVVPDACTDDDCIAALDRLRSLHMLLNREVSRARRVLVTPRPDAARAALGEAFPKLRIVAPAPAGSIPPVTAPTVYIADPLGNVMMRYRRDQIGAPLLDDFERLLKLSGIG